MSRQQPYSTPIWAIVPCARDAAEATFRETLKTEGLAAFRDEGNVVATSRLMH